MNYVGNVVHDGVLVVDREVVVAGDGGHGAEAGQVVLAAAGGHGGARGVGVVRLRDGPEQLDVAVAQGRGGPAAAAVPAAAQGVGGARGHLLRAQLLQLTAGDGRVRLNLLGRGKSLENNPIFQITFVSILSHPARATGSLVLDLRDSVPLPPVHALGQLLGGHPGLLPHSRGL